MCCLFNNDNIKLQIRKQNKEKKSAIYLLNSKTNKLRLWVVHKYIQERS